MFALTDEDLRGRILGCGDGPAGFNAEATRRGVRVTSCDPIYDFSTQQVRARIAATAEQIVEQTERNRDEFIWTEIRSSEDLRRVRLAAMEEFLADYDAGLNDGRYIPASLPSLPFAGGSFDLAVCSHFLFLYSEQLGEQFHEDAVLELCRVADEVRIFPVLALGGLASPHVVSTTSTLRDLKYTVTIERVPYEFQRGGNEMMRIRSRK
jgi:SAM-dependent methyltransferase